MNGDLSVVRERYPSLTLQEPEDATESLQLTETVSDPERSAELSQG